MKKNKGGDRKRTVTITIGPKTEAAFAALIEAAAKSNPGAPWTLTQAATACLYQGLAVNLPLYQVKWEGDVPYTHD